MKHSKRLVFLKLGGSLITDKSKPYTANFEIIKNLALQIKYALDADQGLQLIIGNGSGSFAHFPAVNYKMKEGIKRERQKMGFCLVQDAAARLNRIIVENLLEAGVRAVSVNPSSMIIARDFKIKKTFTDPLMGYLDLGLIPVFYGDIVYDQTKGSAIFSTERLITAFAVNFKKKGILVSKIIQNGSTKGVLDENGAVISHINNSSFSKVKKSFFKTSGYDITGGMLHKIQESLILTRFGIKTVIINGAHKKNLLKDALLDKQTYGTIIG